MLRVAPAWLSGYAGRILLLVILVNFGMQTARYAYGLTLPAMRDTLSLSYSQAGALITALASVNMVASLVTGVLVPRYGSRFIIGGATILLGVAMALLGVSSSFLFALAMSGLIGLAWGGGLLPYPRWGCCPSGSSHVPGAPWLDWPPPEGEWAS